MKLLYVILSGTSRAPVTHDTKLHVAGTTVVGERFNERAIETIEKGCFHEDRTNLPPLGKRAAQTVRRHGAGRLLYYRRTRSSGSRGHSLCQWRFVHYSGSAGRLSPCPPVEYGACQS